MSEDHIREPQISQKKTVPIFARFSHFLPVSLSVKISPVTKKHKAFAHLQERKSRSLEERC
jgi:hypothetical protein